MREKRERERKKRENFFILSKIYKDRMTVFVGARGKVHPRIESYAWISKSRSFVKFHEVEKFSTLVISSLKAI